MSSLFNPSPLTLTEVKGLLDIQVTWHKSNRTEEAVSAKRGATLMTIAKTDTTVTFTLSAQATGLAHKYKMTKSVTLNQKYPIQEYSDKDFYVLFDSSVLMTATNVELEPYCVMFDDDDEALYDKDLTFTVDGGLDVKIFPDGLEMQLTPPMLSVLQVVQKVGFRSINGIKPSNGNIQIRGIEDTIITVSPN